MLASNGFELRGIILHSAVYVANLSKVVTLGFCQMQKKDY